MKHAGITGWLLAGTLVLGGSAALAGPPGGSAGEAGNGARVVRGEIARVNEARGTLTLRTTQGDVEVHLPPAAVKGLRKGDRLTVRLAVQPAPATAESAKRGGGAPKTP